MYFYIGNVIEDLSESNENIMYAILDTDTCDVDVLTKVEYQECMNLGFKILSASNIHTYRRYKQGTSKIVAKKVDRFGFNFIISYIESLALFATLDFKLGLETAIYELDRADKTLTLQQEFRQRDDILFNTYSNIEEPSSNELGARRNNIYALRYLEYMTSTASAKSDIFLAKKDGMLFKKGMHDLTVSSISVMSLSNGSFLIKVTITGFLEGTLFTDNRTKRVVNTYLRQFYYLYDTRTYDFHKCLLTLDDTDWGSGGFYGFRGTKLVTLPRTSSNWVLFRAMLNKSYIRMPYEVKDIAVLEGGSHLKLLGDKDSYSLYPLDKINSLTDEDRRYWTQF